MANRISLKEKLRLLSRVKLAFSGLSTKKAQDGTTVVTLELAEPIEEVKGTQRFVDPNTKKSMPYAAYDVTEIHVHESNITDGFQFDEDGDSGVYEGENELFLDVTKNGEVWLVSESFANMGNTMRNNGRNARVDDVIKRQLDRATAAGKYQPSAAEGKLQPTEA